MAKTFIVIPCYDEALRLPVDRFVDPSAGRSSSRSTGRSTGQGDETRFIFVNDGSRDATADVLRELCARDPERFSWIDQPRNMGKAEAVRAGMREAFSRGARYAGYFDADLATPLSEVARMEAVLDRQPEVEIVFGARVQLLGRNIQRRSSRHYLGRVFATVASLTLDLAVYDTQCGAKLFRATPAIQELFEDPFLTSWIFDVEIVARLIAQRRGRDLCGADRAIYELPLDDWIDVAGSKLRLFDFVRSIWEMGTIHRRYMK